VRKVQIAALTVASLAVACGYYGLADSLDLVPGPLTVSTADYVVQPFPTPAAAPATPTIEGPADDAPIPDAGVLSGYAATLAADSMTGGGTVAVSVIDVATGEELVDHSATRGLTPASSNKVLTAWAALSLLGADHTLQTTTVLQGSTVTLVGGGDVLLANDAGDSSAVAGHAGLGDLARQTAEALQAKGVTSVSVALDDTLFTGSTWNAGWEEGNEAWVGQVQPIMIDVSAHHEAGDYPADPAMEAAQAFAGHLAAAGITVDGQVAREAAPQSATDLASVSSAPLADILSLSLKTSDNTMTEVEGRLVAVAAGETADFEGAARAVLAQLKADGFDTSGTTLVDGSGLALGNKVPARLLAEVLARAAGPRGGVVGRVLIASLPVASLDGTLDDRFVGTTGAGTVRAKTGSLNESASLSGVVVTQDGRLLAFAVIVDGFPDGGLTSARVAIDEDFVIPLSACGCSG